MKSKNFEVVKSGNQKLTANLKNFAALKQATKNINHQSSDELKSDNKKSLLLKQTDTKILLFVALNLGIAHCMIMSDYRLQIALNFFNFDVLKTEIEKIKSQIKIQK